MSKDDYTLSAEETAVASRTVAIVEGEPPEPLTERDRNALRAFLQRGETRLSTYQRVAGVFLNGAGLLVLLPGLARESVFSSVAFVLTNQSLTAALILIPWIFATVVPLWAFFLLLRDLVQFYFSPTFLESDPIRITRFALAGVTLPYDESVEAKAQVIAHKVIGRSYADFILGGTSPHTIKKVHEVSKGGRGAFPLRLEIMDKLNSHHRSDMRLTAADNIGMAFSLAGSLDLSLVGEVARMEASAARHVLQLRKLVLRYSKALILFVWTTLFSIGVAALLDPSVSHRPLPEGASVPLHLPPHLQLSLVLTAYFFWAEVAIYLIRLPVRWIDSLMPLLETGPPGDVFRDPDLAEFEQRVSLVLHSCAILMVLLLVFVWRTT